MRRLGVRLYEVNGPGVVTVTESNAIDMVWWPDSSGLFYLGETGDLHFYDMRLETTRLIAKPELPDIRLLPPIP